MPKSEHACPICGAGATLGAALAVVGALVTITKIAGPTVAWRAGHDLDPRDVVLCAMAWESWFAGGRQTFPYGV